MQNFQRYNWEDAAWEKGENLLKASANRGGQFSCDDVNVSAGKSRNAVPDPRFKRVVGTVMYDEIANEARKVSESLARAAAAAPKDDEVVVGTELMGLNKGSKIPTFLMKKNVTKPNESSAAEETSPSKTFRTPIIGPHDSLSPNEKSTAETDSKTKQVEQDSTKAEISKKSFSDCTLHTKNASDDPAEELPRPLSYSSATRLNKVNHWIQHFKPAPEKRRSVITVIGQTQGKSLSTVLNEINQRRKLAKELDRHALCEAILQTSETAGEREPKNLIAKVDLFSPDGKIVYSARKTFGFREPAFEALRLEKFQECPYSNGDLLRKGVSPFKLRDQIPERDLPFCQTRKRKSKRSPRRVDAVKFDFGRIISLPSSFIQNQMAMAVTVLFCAAIFAAILFTLKDETVLNYLHLRRPKTRTWYDQLFA